MQPLEYAGEPAAEDKAEAAGASSAAIAAPIMKGIAPFGRAVGFGPGYGTCSPDDYGYGYCGSTFSVGW